MIAFHRHGLDMGKTFAECMSRVSASVSNGAGDAYSMSRRRDLSYNVRVSVRFRMSTFECETRILRRREFSCLRDQLRNRQALYIIAFMLSF